MSLSVKHGMDATCQSGKNPWCDTVTPSLWKILAMPLLWLLNCRLVLTEYTNSSAITRTVKFYHFWNTEGAFHLGKKAESSVGARVEFPIGKKLFHLVVNPGTSLRPTVAAWNWYKLREMGTWNTNFRSGKRSHLSRFSTFSGNFPVRRTDETCSIYRRTGNSGNFD